MKITEEKHNHRLTNLLKIFIFSVLMTLPFLNVAVRCGYVMLNKNAYQSYSGNVKTNEYVNIQENLPKYNLYFSFNNELEIDNFTSNSNFFYVSNVEYIEGNLTNTYINTIENTNTLQLWLSSNGYRYFTCPNLGTNFASNGYYFTLKVDLLSYSISNETTQINGIFYNIKDINSLDNVFEYSINKLEEEQYLAWTQNTAVYQGVESMTTGLGITQTVIPMLIVYWFMLTIIYVIIDIVLAIFTKLTHMIGNKTT